MRLVLALVAAVTPSLAAAAPVTVVVGAAFRGHPSEPDDYAGVLQSDGRGRGPSPAVSALVGYKIHPRVALGVRGAIAWRTYASDFIEGMMLERHDYRAFPADVGLAAQYVEGRAWFAAWAGRHYTGRRVTSERCMLDAGTETCQAPTTMRDWTSDGFAVGIGGGVDVWRRGDHRFDVTIEAQLGASYGATSIGLAYRL